MSDETAVNEGTTESGQTSQNAEIETLVQARIAEYEKTKQSEIDRAVTNAIRTREENIKRELEKKTLEEKGEFQKLLESERAEKESILQNLRMIEEDQKRNEYIMQNNLSNFKNVFKNVPLDSLDAVASDLKSVLKATVEAEINKKISTTSAPTATKPDIVLDTNQDVSIQLNKMTPDELRAYLKR